MTEDIKLTFGAELEWSDIDRSINIPKDLGSWEGPLVGRYNLGSEIDIVNTRGKWAGVATDPLAIDCPVGGEIHTVPSTTVDSQFYRIMRILDLFPTVGVACPNHGHIHVGVPGLLKPENLQILKNIFKYVEANESYVLEGCCGLTARTIYDIQHSSVEPWVKSYMLCGDAKKIDQEVYEEVQKSRSPETILRVLKHSPCLDYDYVMDKDGSYVRAYVPTENSHRTAVNLFNLTKMESIEFRAFRATLNPEEIYSCLKFCEMFMKEAMKGDEGVPVRDLMMTYNFKFPMLEWDEELALGWQKTRHQKGRSGPFKKSSGILRPTEDRLVINPQTSEEFEKSLVLVKDLCQKSLEFKIGPLLGA